MMGHKNFLSLGHLPNDLNILSEVDDFVWLECNQHSNSRFHDIISWTIGLIKGQYI